MIDDYEDPIEVIPEIRSSKAKEKEKLQRANEVKDLEWVASTEQGRRFLYRVISHTGPYTATHVNSELAQYRDGVRSVGSWLVSELDENKTLQEAWIRMQMEALIESQKEKLNG